MAVLAALVGIAAAVLLVGLQEKAAPLRATVEDGVSGKFIRHSAPREVADIAFTDGGGQTRRLSDWRGRAVLLNLWATWCAPCKTEMPSLDRLQAKLGSPDFAVVALSMDRTGLKEPAAFFASQGIAHLQLYNDNTGEATTRIAAAGLPSTIVLNGKGQEIARLVGPADWDSADMIAQVEALKAGGISGRAASPAIAEDFVKRP